MENPEETLQVLEEWAARRARPSGGGVDDSLPRQLDEYLVHVARTGDPVFSWSSVKPLFKEKLLNAAHEFDQKAPTLEVPFGPNVDPFNYEAMCSLLLERLDSFNAAPFTVQRLCELLSAPRKQYNRIDKFMRAVEKNVLVVSTREPGSVRRDENESLERALNGSDANSDCGVDVDMEDSTWRDLRQPTDDPLASVSNPEHEQSPQCSAPIPEVPVAIMASLAPAEEKMEEVTEVNETTSKEKSQKIEQKIEPAVDVKLQVLETESMDVEVTKDPEQSLEVGKPRVFVVSSVSEVPILEQKPNEVSEASGASENIENVTVPVISGSEDDSNSNPEPTRTVSETEPEVQKPESVTSGEDSSSSSENTDGEERAAGDSSNSQQSEPSTMSEGDSSNEPTETIAATEQKEEVKEVLASIEPENYTIADIPAQPKEEEKVEKEIPSEPASSASDTEEKHEIPLVEKSDETVPIASVEEPMQTDSTEKTPELL